MISAKKRLIALEGTPGIRHGKASEQDSKAYSQNSPLDQIVNVFAEHLARNIETKNRRVPMWRDPCAFDPDIGWLFSEGPELAAGRQN